MSCLRSMRGVIKRYRVRNEEIRRSGLQRSLSERRKASVLRLFGHCKNGGREVSVRFIGRMWRVTAREVGQGKGCLNDRGLTIPEVKSA